jgi:hypothetical protein
MLWRSGKRCIDCRILQLYGCWLFCVCCLLRLRVPDGYFIGVSALGLYRAGKVTWRSLLAFFSAPGDAKSDGMVPFGRGDAKSGVVSFGLDAPGRADMAAGPCTLAPSPTTLVPPSRRQPPVAPPVAIAATRERERERERERNSNNISKTVAVSAGSSAGSRGPRWLPPPALIRGAHNGRRRDRGPPTTSFKAARHRRRRLPR